jgi:hypothetical protein
LNRRKKRGKNWKIPEEIWKMGKTNILFSATKKLILPASRIEERNTEKLDSFIRLFLNLSTSNFHDMLYLGRVKCDPCYYGMARLQVADAEASRYRE